MQTTQQKFALIVLQVGLAFSFLYASVMGFVNPEGWISWFPKFMRHAIGDDLLLKTWGVYELITGIWLLTNRQIFWPSLVASFSLAGLIVFNLNAFDILFRDVSIWAMAVALTMYYFPKKSL